MNSQCVDEAETTIQPQIKRLSTDNLVKGLRDVVDIAWIDTSHGNAAVLGHVDVEFFNHPFDLCGVQACERKHADLISDVVPGTWRTLGFNSFSKCRAHIVDAVGHQLQLVKPFFLQLWCGQHFVDDSSSMAWGTRVRLADKNFDLGKHRCCQFLPICLDMDVADALAVQPEVFGERLSDEVLQARLLEHELGHTILHKIARCIALVCIINYRNELARLTHLHNGLPLVCVGVNTCWILRTGVQKHCFTLWDFVQSCHASVEVKATGGLMVVRVLGRFKPSPLENSGVVAPGWVWNVDCLYS